MAFRTYEETDRDMSSWLVCAERLGKGPLYLTLDDATTESLSAARRFRWEDVAEITARHENVQGDYPHGHALAWKAISVPEAMTAFPVLRIGCASWREASKRKKARRASERICNRQNPRRRVRHPIRERK